MKMITALVFMALATVFVGCDPAVKTTKEGAVYAVDGPYDTLTSPAPTSSDCTCTSDLYSCTSFDTQSRAQACYDHCQSLGVGDIHRLETNQDGTVCEELP